MFREGRDGTGIKTNQTSTNHSPSILHTYLSLEIAIHPPHLSTAINTSKTDQIKFS